MSKVSPECQTMSCSSGKVLSLRGASVKFINYRKNLVDLTSLAVSYLKQYTQKDLCTYTIQCFIISRYNRFGSTSSQPTLGYPLTLDDLLQPLATIGDKTLLYQYYCLILKEFGISNTPTWMLNRSTFATK